MESQDIVQVSRGGGFASGADRFDIPILFLNWIRDDLTVKTFEQIRKIKPKRLYVAFDGPRNDEDKERIEKTKAVIDVDWDCDVKFLLREENLGCKKAVSEAITWFFEQEEMGIILEDDCYPDLSFFPFCEELLHKYKDDTRVMTISGTCGFNSPAKYSYRYEKYFACWGWASWRRAWKFFDIDMKDFELFEEEDAIKKYIVDYLDRRKYFRMFKIHSQHSEKSWAWIFTYNLLCQNALCIRSNKNLVTNIGMNHELSTHVQESNVYNNLESIQFPLKHPHFIGVEKDFNESHVCHYVFFRIVLFLISCIPIKKYRKSLRNYWWLIS